MHVRGPIPAPLTLAVNGEGRLIDVEPRVSLLDALREDLDLTGSKKGCAMRPLSYTRASSAHDRVGGGMSAPRRPGPVVDLPDGHPS